MEQLLGIQESVHLRRWDPNRLADPDGTDLAPIDLLIDGGLAQAEPHRVIADAQVVLINSGHISSLLGVVQGFHCFRAIQDFHEGHDFHNIGSASELREAAARPLKMHRVSDERVWFVADRFEALRDLLFASGYALDPGPRDPNEWDEIHYEDPPTGVVRMKGVRLRDLDAEDSDFDPEITFTIHELWSTAPAADAISERGFFLMEYSYHAHWHGIDQRWDFDPTGHPEMPYHRHPPSRGTRREPLAGPIQPADAIRSFHEWVERAESIGS